MTENDAPPVQKAARRAYHERLVEAFVRHSRVEDVCIAVGLSRRTVQRWRSSPEWWAEVETARGEVLSDALGRLRSSLPGLADELVGVAMNRDEPAAVRVRAATAVFETFAKLSERAELEQRLSAIEGALGAGRAGGGITDIRQSSVTFIANPYAAPIPPAVAAAPVPVVSAHTGGRR